MCVVLKNSLVFKKVFLFRLRLLFFFIFHFLVFENKDLGFLLSVTKSAGAAERVAMVVTRRHRTLGIWFWMSSWYVCSLMTLLMTKTILSTKRVDVNELGIAQLLTTAFLGSLKVLGPSILQVMNCTRMRRPMFQSYRKQRRKSDGILPVSHDLNNSGRGSKQVKAKRSGSRFWEDMIYLGLLRGSTVALKLLSLSLLAASFTETVKASAPIVTVLFAWLILKEKTTLRLVASLFPIMAGLIICSATELSFNTIGFMVSKHLNAFKIQLLTKLFFVLFFCSQPKLN